MLSDLHFAVVVGIDQYPGMPTSLRFARSDAKAFASWLIDPEGGGLPEENVRLVIVPGEDMTFEDATTAVPTQSDVNAALREINKLVREKVRAQPADWLGTRLYFYAAGHGIAPVGGRAALLMANASTDELGQNVEISLYAQWYEECSVFRELVFLADCCRERKRGARGFGPPFTACETRHDPPNRILWFATSLGESAFEPIDSDADPDQTRGYFTQALLEGLSAANADPNTGEIDSNQLARFVYQAVLTRTKDTFPQEARVDADPANPIVFRRPRQLATQPRGLTTYRVTLHFPSGCQGTVVLRRGDLSEIDRHDCAAGPWPCDLETGIYLVEPADRGRLAAPFVEGGIFRVLGEDRDVHL